MSIDDYDPKGEVAQLKIRLQKLNTEELWDADIVSLLTDAYLMGTKNGMTKAAAIVNEARFTGESDLRCVRSQIESARDNTEITLAPAPAKA